jgi:hypothetical protein
VKDVKKGQQRRAGSRQCCCISRIAILAIALASCRLDLSAATACFQSQIKPPSLVAVVASNRVQETSVGAENAAL